MTGPRWGTAVFRVGSRTYTWLDIVLFAMANGDWQPFALRLQQGLACVDDADRLDELPDHAQLESAANAFRYERDLLTSEETEEWLERAGFDMDAWSDALARQLLRVRWADRLHEVDAASIDPSGIDEVTVVAEGMCTGAFARFAMALAERAGMAASGNVAIADGAGREHTRDVIARHDGWLGAVDADVEERLAHITVLIAADAEEVRAGVTPASLAAHLDRARLDWIRVDLEQLSFPREAAAREAALCVREDGLSLSEVAIESRQSVVDRRALIDELDPALRDAVLSASAGDTIGPIAVSGRYLVAHVVAKSAATLDDPLVRARAERAVVDSVRQRAALSHVIWIERPAQ